MSEVESAWSVGAFLVERGLPVPLGASETVSGINFAVYSKHATAVTLVLFWTGVDDPVAEIPLDPSLNRTGQIWHIQVRRLDPSVRYGWRVDGPHQAEKGHRFDPRLILIDPYAKALTGGSIWGEPEIRRVIKPTAAENKFLRRCCLAPKDFDWNGDVPPRTPLADSIIYELHVRGFTIHPSANVTRPGTFLGLTEKIPYLQKLGVTAVELMPICEFDENENLRHNPRTKELLRNFWGYSSLAFFAPKASYASEGRDGKQVNEFKEMVKQFHRAGIEVFLDVVFNHTAEGDERGPTVSFRGLDNAVYYMLDKHGKYRNFSGCGNTVNCNHPLIRDLILDCLRYWVAEMHVDGFRFDLASVLGRGPDGEVLADPPLLERIAADPVLADAKLIAEAWDAGGLNQVGRFPNWGRWAEWNGFFRDQLRLFWKGEPGLASAAASRICGSDDLYAAGRKPHHSINFITAHDGFTLHDLVSYEQKHNEENGEENHDGENYNHSQNFGVEGPSDDPKILALRRRMMKNLLATLFVSQGVPMLLGGDEFARTQKGNNNAYCQDNEISWVDWTRLAPNVELQRFTAELLAFRRRHSTLRRRDFFRDDGALTWHGERANQPDWSPEAKWLAFLLNGDKTGGEPDAHLYVMLNAATDWRHFEVPHVGREWRRVIDTAKTSPEDICADEAAAPRVGHHHGRYGVEPRSVVVLVAPR